MIPFSLSATAIDTATKCLRRFEGSHMNRISQSSGRAANNGSACHGALEHYINQVYIDKTHAPDLSQLLAWYHVEVIDIFGVTDIPEYPEGVDMLTRWFNRTDFTDVRVVSTEQKKSFQLPTSAGPIQFNYILDRFDQIGPREYKVVDYKTNRWGYSAVELRKKTQPRVYALATAIELKAAGIEYDYIWVEFDLLRHDPVGTRFSREDNHATWNKLIEVAERIIKTPEGGATPTLNSECLFCPVKATCPALTSNIAHGGIMSLSQTDKVDLRAKLDFQKKAITAALTEIDEMLIAEARELDELDFVSNTNRMTVTASQRRGVDADMVERVVGHDLFDRYGGKSLTMANFNQLLKDPSVASNPEMTRRLNGLVGIKIGQPTIKIEPLGFLES